MAKPKKPQREPAFRVGDKVRVKMGIPDPDYPDIPLGGRVGTVKEVDQAEPFLRPTFLHCSLASVPGASLHEVARALFAIYLMHVHIASI